MCFYINSKHPNKKIAKKDITCYKILWNDYTSLYQSKLYKLNKLYKGKIEKSYSINKVFLIDRGFHSYSSLKRTVNERASIIRILNPISNTNYTFQQFIIVKCIIPKGSEYYYNPDRHEYVSNQIILQEIIK